MLNLLVMTRQSNAARKSKDDGGSAKLPSLRLLKEQDDGNRVDATLSIAELLNPSLPKSILAHGSKEKRDAVHKVVFDFRRKFGEPSTKSSCLNVKLYNDKIELLPARLKSQIEKIASPKAYAAIRQAGRMRQSMPPLPEDELAQLSIEIRAALVWGVIGQ